jgi:predicted histone-like DNA-binding protein
MALKLKKIQRASPLDRTQVKWYFTQEKSGTLGMEEIAKAIAARSSLSYGDVLSVLRNLVELLPKFLKMGVTIVLKGFGSFHATVKSQGTDTPEELTTRNVKGVKVSWVPSREIKTEIASMEFETV